MVLHEYLEYRAREFPDVEFATDGIRRMTYAEAAAAIGRIAGALDESGLEPGDRIGFLSKNSIEYVLLYYGASKAGIVPVPLNYRLAPAEWTYILEDAEVKLVVAGGMCAGAIDGIRAALPRVRRWVAIGEPRAGWDDFAKWSAEARPLGERPSREDGELYQMYTSGTTGRPKGAVIPQRSMAAQLVQLGYTMGLAIGERALVAPPLYHAAGALVMANAVQWGASLYVLEEFQPAEAVRVLSEERIVSTLLVPAMIQACLVQAPDASRRTYPKLRLITYGASPIAERTLRSAIEVFGCGFLGAYGMTETTGVLTNFLPSDHRRALEHEPEMLLSVGRPMIGTEIRVVDDRDETLPTGEVGEIIARGPQLMRGYWKMPEATEKALRGGWMHTGDAGRVDARGYLFIQDRVKDMIVSGGENIYPREVEDVLFQHPAVADVAVIGVPNEQWGETVKAVVVLKPDVHATEADLIDHCRGRLGGYKRPRSVDFVSSLPRNPSGKVLKREIREPYWVGHVRRVAGA